MKNTFESTNNYKDKLLEYQKFMKIVTAEGLLNLLSSDKFSQLSDEHIKHLDDYGILGIGKDDEIRFDSNIKKDDFIVSGGHDVADIIRMIRTNKLDKDYVLNDFKKMLGGLDILKK